MKNLTAKILLLLLPAATLTGCNQTGPRGNQQGELGQLRSAGNTKEGRAAVTGRVIDSAGVPNARVELRLVRSRPAPPDTTSQTTTDGEGHFTVIPREPGPYEIVAHLPFEDGATYTAFVSVGDAAPAIVSPLSTIASGLVRHALRLGVASDHAIQAGLDAFSAHLRIAHMAHAEPVAWPLQNTTLISREGVTPAVQAQLVMQALSRIALGVPDISQDAPLVPSLATLANVFAEDAEADGTIDGRGFNAQPLRLAGQRYDGAILRSELAQHLLDIVDDEKIGKRADYCKTARAIVQSPQTAVANPSFPGHFSCQTQQLTVSGRVAFIDPHERWQVDAWSVGDDGAATLRRGGIDIEPGNRSFTFDVYGNTGPLLLRAFPVGRDATHYFSIVTPPVGERARIEVGLGPLWTLSAAYARGMVRKEQIPLDEALHAASAKLGRHFGVDLRASDVADTFDIESWLASDAPLSQSERANLLCRALAQLADTRSNFSTDAKPRLQKLLQLTWLLSEDVIADATFDGAGDARNPLALEGYLVSGKTLRADLTQSLLSLMYAAHASAHPQSLALPPSTTMQQAQSWARSFLESTQKPFLSSFDAIPQTGPSFINRCFYVKDQQRIPLLHTLRGVIRVDCEVDPAHFLANANVTVTVADRPVAAVGNFSIDEANRHRSGLRFSLDTREISAFGGGEASAVITIEATNTLGAVGTTNIYLMVDNTKPVLSCKNCEKVMSHAARGEIWVGPGALLEADFSVSGRAPFHIETRNPDLNLTWSHTSFADQEVDENNSVSTYRLTGERKSVSPSAVYPIEISVQDGAGNDSNYTLLARWPNDGPAFAHTPITFVSFDHFKNNAVQAPARTPTEPIAVVSHRYANHLDYAPSHDLPPASHPLPMLYFHLAPDDPNALPAETVEYRATPYTDDSFVSPALLAPTQWRAAHAPQADQPAIFYLPLSFQTLLPQDMLADPQTASQSTRLLMHNSASTGPAAWKIEVRATDRFGNQSHREADILFDVRLPGISPLNPNSAQWCQRRTDCAALYRHWGLVYTEVHWPMFESEHSLFRRPAVNIRLTYPRPPVTYIDKTEWVLEKIPGKRTVGSGEKNEMADQKARQCEKRLNNHTFDGIWIEAWDQCVSIPSTHPWEKGLFVGSNLIPLSEAKREWLVTPAGTEENFLMTESTLWVKSRIDQLSEFRTPTSSYEPMDKNGNVRNVRALLTESNSIIYAWGRRQERLLREFAVEASTVGQALYTFEVKDPFLKLDMQDLTYLQDISCKMQPSAPWQE